LYLKGELKTQMINNIIDPKTIRKINRDNGNLGPVLRQVRIYDGAKAE